MSRSCQLLVEGPYVTFYKYTVMHFLFSVAGAVLFVLGLKYSAGSDGESNTPYFFPAMVLSGLHFILVVSTFIIWRSYNNGNINDSCTRYARVAYYFLQPIMIVWGIIGASIAGHSGLCRGENLCYYTVNEDENLAVAGSILGLHCLNILAMFLIMICKGGETPPPGNVKPLITTYDRTKLNTGNTWKRPSDNPPLPKIGQINLIAKKDPIPDKKPNLKRVNSDITIQNKSTSANMLPYPRELTRLKTKATEDLSDSGVNSRQEDKPVPKPLPPYKNKDKVTMMIKTVGKVNILYKNVSEKRRQKDLPILHVGRETDESSSTISSSSSEKEKPFRLARKLKRRSTDQIAKDDRTKRVQDRPAPPSYNDVMFNDWNNPDHRPYNLPPMPDSYPGYHRVPSNMYSGTSYPDSAPVITQPAKAVVKRHTSNL